MARHAGGVQVDRLGHGAEGEVEGRARRRRSRTSPGVETFSRTFGVAGRYDDFCGRHEGVGMTGTVVVIE